MKKIISLLLTFVMVLSLSACGSSERTNWSDVAMSNVLPTPASTSIKVQTNTDQELYGYIQNISAEQYDEFVAACKDKGFNVYVEENETDFKAFNEAGYYIDLHYADYEKYIVIDMDAPKIMETLEWAEYDNAKQIPVPVSKVADVRNKNDVRYELYVGETSFDDYVDYVQSCKDKGFTVDATETDHTYHAFNEGEYELTVEHHGGDVMYIEVVEKRVDVEIKLLHTDSTSADMYDLRIEIDDMWEEDSDKGDEAVAFESHLKEGKHILKVENDDDDDINGRIEFNVTDEDVYFEFDIECLSNKINISLPSESEPVVSEPVITPGPTTEPETSDSIESVIADGVFSYTANTFGDRFEEALGEYSDVELAIYADIDNDKLIIDETYYLFYRIQEVDNNYSDIGMVSFSKPGDITLPVIDEYVENKFDTINVLVEDINDVPFILPAAIYGADPNLDFTEAYNLGVTVADNAGTAEGYTHNGINYVVATDDEYYFIIISTTGLSSSDYTTSSEKVDTTTTVKNYCDAPGCTSEGTKTYKGISGATEYYCSTHYNELINMMSAMEEDVGKSSYSKHTCEECSREGTNSIIGISGQKEYYCSTHYKELQEFMEIFGQ